MGVPTIPKKLVKTLGYIGVIIMFLIATGIGIAVFLPQLVKPVAELPPPKLNAKVDFLQDVYVGDQWFANVTLYNDSPTTAYNVSLKLDTDVFGSKEINVPEVMGHSSDVVTFSELIPKTTPQGNYKFSLTIESDGTNPSTYTLAVNVYTAPEESGGAQENQ